MRLHNWKFTAPTLLLPSLLPSPLPPHFSPYFSSPPLLPPPLLPPPLLPPPLLPPPLLLLCVQASDGPTASSFSNPRKTGWLYKHGGSGMSSHWRKRWFIVDHHYLFYYKGPNVRHRDFCWRCIVCVDGLECYFSWVFPPPVGIGIGCIYPLPPFSDFYKTNQFLSIVPIMCKTLINCRDSTKHLWRHNLIPPGKWPSSSTSGHVQR